MSNITAFAKKSYELGKIYDENRTIVEERNLQVNNYALYRWDTVITGCIPYTVVNIAYINSIDQYSGDYEAFLTDKNMSAQSNEINVQNDGTNYGYKLVCTGGILRFQGKLDGQTSDIIIREGNEIEFTNSIQGKIYASVEPLNAGVFYFDKYTCASAHCGYAVKKLICLEEDHPIPPYVPPVPVTFTVTFNIFNGKWDDGTGTTKTITLSGTDQDLPVLSETDIPGAGNDPDEGYREGYWDTVPEVGTIIDSDTYYNYYYQEIPQVSYTLTFKVLHGSWDDGTTEDKEVVLTGTDEDIIVLHEEDIPEVGNNPDEGYQAGAWVDIAPMAEELIISDMEYTYSYMESKEPEDPDLVD